MKMSSWQRDSNGNQLICEDVILDPDLMEIKHIDPEEKVMILGCDFSECGHPLNLPFEAENVDFVLKITKYNIHICAISEPTDEGYAAYEQYANNLGNIEFNVRMSAKEKNTLLNFIAFNFLSQSKPADNM